MPGFSSLPGVGDAEAGAHAKWSGVPQVFGPKWLQMPILTVGMMGLQIIWSVEMSYGECTRVSRLNAASLHRV
jgi:solute carrier family 45, member 1/2/4